MKKFVLVCLYACITTLYAGTIPLTRYYIGECYSYTKRGATTYALKDTTTNGYTDAYSTTSPYAGGTVINQQTQLLSETGLGVVTLFLNTYSPTYNHPQCWGWGRVNGAITVGTTAQYPEGTPLTLQIDYFIAEIGDLSEEFCYREVMVGDINSNVLWQATHLTSGTESYYLPVTAGTTYTFRLHETLGSIYNPIEPALSSNYLAQGVGIDFSVIVPEPATVALLGLGGLALRKRKKG